MTGKGMTAKLRVWSCVVTVLMMVVVSCSLVPPKLKTNR